MKNIMLAGFVVAVILAANFPTLSTGQDENPADTAEAKAETFRRLPAGYSDIITNAQRRQIYSIQEKYQAKIDDLLKQISAIEKERDDEVAEVLDDEQKQILKFILKIRERNRTEEAAVNSANTTTLPTSGTTGS